MTRGSGVLGCKESIILGGSEGNGIVVSGGHCAGTSGELWCQGDWVKEGHDAVALGGLEC